MELNGSGEALVPRLALDIETVPTRYALALPYPEESRQPPSNYSKPESIAAWRERDKEAWQDQRIKGYSVSARLGRVVHLAMVDGGGQLESLSAPTEGDESRVLAAFWERIKNWPTVVTWNGAWDLRFLLTRSLILGVAPTAAPKDTREWFKRYQRWPHYDVKAALTDNAMSSEGLDEWGTAILGVGKTPGMSGADVYRLYCEGDFAAIARYCEQDVRLTMSLYEKISLYF